MKKQEKQQINVFEIAMKAKKLDIRDFLRWIVKNIKDKGICAFAKDFIKQIHHWDNIGRISTVKGLLPGRGETVAPDYYDFKKMPEYDIMHKALYSALGIDELIKNDLVLDKYQYFKKTYPDLDLTDASLDNDGFFVVGEDRYMVATKEELKDTNIFIKDSDPYMVLKVTPELLQELGFADKEKEEEEKGKEEEKEEDNIPIDHAPERNPDGTINHDNLGSTVKMTVDNDVPLEGAVFIKGYVGVNRDGKMYNEYYLEKASEDMIKDGKIEINTCDITPPSGDNYYNAVTGIKAASIRDMHGLKEVIMPSVVDVEPMSFINCEHLEHISLSEGCYVHPGAFVNCPALQTITIGNMDYTPQELAQHMSVLSAQQPCIASFTTSQIQQFISNGQLNPDHYRSITAEYDDGGNLLKMHQYASPQRLLSVNVGTANSIMPGAFDEMYDLRSADLSRTMHVCNGAFDNCHLLESIAVNPTGVIDNGAFDNCPINNVSCANIQGAPTYEMYGHLISNGQEIVNLTEDRHAPEVIPSGLDERPEKRKKAPQQQRMSQAPQKSGRRDDMER